MSEPTIQPYNPLFPRTDVSSAEILLTSFGYQYDTIISRYAIDIRFLRDPGANGAIRQAYEDGVNPNVMRFMREDPSLDGVILLAKLLAYQTLKAEGTPWVGITIFDHHGRWGAPAVAEILGDELIKEKFTVAVQHPHLNLQKIGGKRK